MLNQLSHFLHNHHHFHKHFLFCLEGPPAEPLLSLIYHSPFTILIYSPFSQHLQQGWFLSTLLIDQMISYHTSSSWRIVRWALSILKIVQKLTLGQYPKGTKLAHLESAIRFLITELGWRQDQPSKSNEQVRVEADMSFYNASIRRYSHWTDSTDSFHSASKDISPLFHIARQPQQLFKCRFFHGPSNWVLDWTSCCNWSS